MKPNFVGFRKVVLCPIKGKGKKEKGIATTTSMNALNFEGYICHVDGLSPTQKAGDKIKVQHLICTTTCLDYITRLYYTRISCNFMVCLWLAQKNESQFSNPPSGFLMYKKEHCTGFINSDLSNPTLTICILGFHLWLKATQKFCVVQIFILLQAKWQEKISTST